MNAVSAPPVSAPQRYSRRVVQLHWLVAGLVLALLATGWYMVELPRNTDARAVWFNVHKTIGILTIVGIAALIVVRLRQPPPPLPGSMPAWERHGALINHMLFYVSLVLISMTGYLTSSFSKYGPKLFNVIPLPQLGWEDQGIRETLAQAHAALALIFAALLVLHVAAALKHLWLDRDGVFERMSPHPKSPR